MFTLIGWALFGLVVGLIARFLTPGRDAMGCLVTIAIGIAGSFLGGALSMLLRGRGLTDFDLHPAGFIMSVIGAIVLLLLFRLVSKK